MRPVQPTHVGAAQPRPHVLPLPLPVRVRGDCSARLPEDRRRPGRPKAAAVDRWLGRLFDAGHIDETCRLLAGADEIDEAAAARVEAAQRALINCNARLAKYRATLEAGTDPAVVAGWIREVEGQRQAAEHTLAESSRSVQPLSASQIEAMAADARAVTRKLAKADSELKGDLYRALGIGVTYLPDTNEIDVVARFQRVCDSACRRGVRTDEYTESIAIPVAA